MQFAEKEVWLMIIGFSLVMIFVIVLFAFALLISRKRKAQHQQEIAEEKIKLQQAEIEKKDAILIERNRIIADLHDDVGGGLSSIRIISELLSYPQNNPQNVIQYAQKILGTVKDVSEKMSTFYWVLNADNDKLQDFCDYVKKYAIDFFADTPIELQYRAQIDTEQELLLNSNQRKNLFLCVKEILNNALKHAQATKIVVAIEAQNITSILIKIQDNGIGINKENQFGNGLKNLQKRASEINADLKFTSDSSGTNYTISLSLAS